MHSDPLPSPENHAGASFDGSPLAGPTADLDAKPGRATRRRTAALLLVVATLGALLTLTSAPPASAAVTGDWSTDMVNQINAFRGANGQGPVRMCANLTTSAQDFANDMAARNYFSHTSPEGSTYVTRNQGAGYTGWISMGENIAAGYGSVVSVMSGWTNSPQHRANLLGAYTDVGLGLAYAANGTPYWVNEFGSGGKCGVKVVGSYDSVVAARPETATVGGWVFDSSGPSQTLDVDVVVDGGFIGRFAANKTRVDIGAAYPAAGPSHGFSIDFNAGPGGHTVCVTANSLTPGLSPSLGCRFVVLASASPIGSFDLASSPSAERVRVGGWALDPETSNSIDVHIYVDGALKSVQSANVSRTDIGSAFPNYGPRHGFDVTLAVAGGSHQVCVYAINQLLGINPLLGCRSVSVANGSPIGSLDSVDLNGPRGISVRGWTIDLETSAPIQIDIYVDGTKAGRFTADQLRGDVGAVFPGSGSAHGYTVPLTVAPGAHTVCTYGINVGAVGGNATLGCRTVTVPGNPIGSLDTVVASGGTLRLGGWALDPDTAASIDVHVYVDGAKKAVVAATESRKDIAAAFPFFGALHGYSVSVPNVAAGSHQVCTYGINSGVGVNTLLACRSVTA